MDVGEDEHHEGVAARFLLAELFGAGGGEGGDAFFEVVKLGVVGFKGAGGGDALFGLGCFQIESGDALKLVFESKAHYGHLFLDPSIGELGEVEGGADIEGLETFGVLATDAPDVFNFEPFERFDAFLVCVYEVDSFCLLGELFGDAVGGFGKRFGGGNAYADGDACPLGDPLAHRFAVLLQVEVGKAGEFQKGFVNAIDFHFGGEFAQDRHDAVAHVAVEGKVGGKDLDIVFLEHLFVFKGGGGHGHKRFGFVTAGNDAAVVV